MALILVTSLQSQFLLVECSLLATLAFYFSTCPSWFCLYTQFTPIQYWYWYRFAKF